jgi:hypothetical protein
LVGDDQPPKRIGRGRKFLDYRFAGSPSSSDDVEVAEHRGAIDGDVENPLSRTAKN